MKRMSRQARFFAAALWLGSAASIAMADPLLPPGNPGATFNGARFGADLAELKKTGLLEGFRLEASEHEMKEFVRSPPLPAPGGARLSSLHYVFFKDRFVSAVLQFNGENNYEKLREFCFETLGPRPGPATAAKFSWDQAGTRIELQYIAQTNEGRLIYAQKGLAMALEVYAEVRSVEPDKALHLALRHDSLDLARIALDRRASPNAKISDGLPALHRSVSGDERIFRLLLERGAELDLANSKYPLLTRAARDGTPAMAREILARGADPNQVNAFGSPPIFDAAANKRAPRAMIDLLIAKGADKNYRGTNGMTLLYAAVMAQASPELIEYVLSLKIDPALADNQGTTPLMMAARAGRIQVVRILLKGGASAGQKDSRGRTALENTRQIYEFKCLEQETAILCENKQEMEETIRLLEKASGSQ